MANDLIKYPDTVVFSHAKDEHALAFLAQTAAGRLPLLLDVSREGIDFVTTLDPSGHAGILARNGHRYALDNVAFWWIRRPAFHHHPETPPPFAAAQEVETTNFWCGLLDCSLNGVWCNPYHSQLRARNKLRQIFVAERCGIKVPDTIWSNDPEQIKAFWERHNRRAIIKMFEGTKDVWQPTRRITESMIESRDAFRFSPSIVQEYVAGVAEYRIIIFGEHRFVARNFVGKSRYAYDVRIDTSSHYEATSPENSLVEPLVRYMREEGLIYAAFDVRENLQGEPVFLEVNPMGQFLYLDRFFDGAILRSFCSFSQGCIKANHISRIEANPPHYIWSEGIAAPYFDLIGDRITHLK